jgi:hypothetical protein
MRRRGQPRQNVTATAKNSRQHARGEHWIQHVSTVLLALAAVATAWSGFQASTWHGEQAEAQSRANAKRLESTRSSDLANRQSQVDLAIFIQWVDAHGLDEPRLRNFYRERFTDRFVPAFRAWIATKPFENPDAPKTPFEMPEYRLAATRQAERLEVEAAAATEEAKEDIQRGDNYVLAVVLFSVSLFFAGISTRLPTHSGEGAILALGCVVFLGTVIWLATLPRSLEI